MQGLRVDNLSKSFDKNQALNGVSFQAAYGEITAVLGPSGCGKSTLLAIIAGLVTPDDGEVIWNGITQNHVPPHKRGFGLMFQDYMLFPHKNVNGNVSFGLEMLGWDRNRINLRVSEVLEFVGIPDYGQRDITTLSGGELQRAALARSIAPNPELLMLDEPISSLDRTLRERLLYELRDILKEMSQTAIYVTHDQEEAFTISDRVVVMNNGLISQVGSPEEIYENPNSEFIARFLGFTNIFTVTYSKNKISTPLGDFSKNEIKYRGAEKEPPRDNIRILIRPDAMQIDGRGNKKCSFEGIIQERSFRGGLSRVLIEINGKSLTLDLQSISKDLIIGEKRCFYFNPEEAIQILN